MRKCFIIPLALILTIIALYSHTVNNINPIIYSYSQARVKEQVKRAVANAFASVIASGGKYDDFIIINRDSDDNIVSLIANAPKVNEFSIAVNRVAYENFDKIAALNIKIPIGTLSGLPILTGIGFDVGIKLRLYVALDSAFQSEFSDGGINQTRHRIYINFAASTEVILIGSRQKIETSSQFLAAESVIVGKVPQFYLSSSIMGDLLNLVP